MHDKNYSLFVCILVEGDIIDDDKMMNRIRDTKIDVVDRAYIIIISVMICISSWRCIVSFCSTHI